MRGFVAFLVVFSALIALGKCQQDACSASLKAANDYRSLHKSPPLKCNSQISSDAQAYANKLAQTCEFKHSGDSRYGENLYMTMTTGTPPSAGDAALAAVNSWYSEEKCYDYNDASFTSCLSSCKKDGRCTMAVGHFTQVVWKGTSEVGVGVSNCVKNGYKQTIVVANYKAPGNYQGEFATNVLRK